jgi:hypothetical protein
MKKKGSRNGCPLGRNATSLLVEASGYKIGGKDGIGIVKCAYGKSRRCQILNSE